MMTSPSVPSPQLSGIGQNSGDKLSPLHHAVRWYYRIVFGTLALGILADAVQAFIEAESLYGDWNFLPFEKFSLVHFALSYPLYFYSLSIPIVGLGILGFIYEQRHKRIQ